MNVLAAVFTCNVQRVLPKAGEKAKVSSFIKPKGDSFVLLKWHNETESDALKAAEPTHRTTGNPCMVATVHGICLTPDTS